MDRRYRIKEFDPELFRGFFGAATGTIHDSDRSDTFKSQCMERIKALTI
jgi:hypothetical protein